MTNRSKRERLHRPARPEFGMAGIAIGLGAGMAVGFVAEVAAHRGMMVMQAGGAAGAAVGALVEALRFWWRRRKFHDVGKT